MNALLLVLFAPDIDKLAEDAFSQFKKLEELLKSAKDEEGLKKELPKLKALDAELRKIDAALCALKPEQSAALAKKHGKESAALRAGLEKEMKRLGGVAGPRLHAMLDILPFKKRDDDAKAKRAATDCKKLAEQVHAYYVEAGEFPPSLDTLAKPPSGGKPYVPAERLKDPWGKKYQLQVVTDGAGVERVEVFTLGPGGERISNLGIVPAKKK
ncbi:MAG: type II secretion system protein GspG [Gemmataceae bacterium]|nr:type II secretion system protein GspG [Gemmataceae bacterium]